MARDGNGRMYHVDFIGDSTYSILPEDKIIGFSEKFKEFSQRKSKKLRDAINCAKKIISGSTTYEIEREKFKNRTKKGKDAKTGSASNEEMIEEFSDDTEFTEDNFGANTNQSNPPPLTRNGYTNPNGVVPNTGYLRKHIPQNNTLDETSSVNNNNNNKSKRRKVGSITQPTQNPSSTNNNGNNSFSGTLGTRRRGNATNGHSSGANQTGPTHKRDHSDNNSVSNSGKPNANNDNEPKRNSRAGKNTNKGDGKEASKSGNNDIPSVNHNCEVRDQDIGATVNWFNG